MNTELAVIEQNPAALFNRATDVAGVCSEIVKRTAQTIQGRKYVKVEGWQSIAAAYGCVASSTDVEKVDGGVRAIGRLHRVSDGALVASAEGFVGEDETTWYGGEGIAYGKPKMLPKRPDYAIRAMAQTRAISRVCRSAFAFVVVLIDGDMSTTPAEEMAGVVATQEAPKPMSASDLKKALAQFREHGIDEAKITACLGKPEPWTKADMNFAWNALVEKHEETAI